MMIVQRNNSYNINYEKDDGSVSTRKIISMTDIPQNITALDVTGLHDGEIADLIDKLNEYKAYVDSVLSSCFDFKTWYEQTQNTVLDDKFQKIRRFKRDKIKEI